MLHLGSGRNVPQGHRYPELSVCVGKGLGGLEPLLGTPGQGPSQRGLWNRFSPQ